MKQIRLLCLVVLTAFCMGIGGVNHSLYAQYPRYQTITTFAGNGQVVYSEGDKQIAKDAAGNLYITDPNGNVVTKFTKSSGTISIIAGTTKPGYNGDNQLAVNAFLKRPSGVTVDASGNVYISDQQNYRVRRVDAASGVITTIAGNGIHGATGDGGPATAAKLFQPAALTVDGSGNIYVADNYKIRKIDVATGIITTVAGTGIAGFSGDGGPGSSATFSTITDVKVDGGGNLFIADWDNYRIRKIDMGTGIVSTVAGNGTPTYLGDGGPATAAGGDFFAMEFDASGNIYVADYSNCIIRKVAAGTNIISKVAGTGVQGSAGDGGPALNANLWLPIGIAIDPSGNIELLQEKYQTVRKIDPATGIISLLIDQGSLGDGGLAQNAVISDPRDVAVDASGNVYFVDGVQNRVRKVNASTKIITTVAGNGTKGYSGDGGPATSASLNYPAGVALDAIGNLYIADEDNNRIRKVDATTGIITTVAGNGVNDLAGMNGPATAASVGGPVDITFDAIGNMYFSCLGVTSQAIFKVDAVTKVISTIAGTGTEGYSNDGGLAVNAALSYPHGLVFDAAGNLIFCDKFSDRVRKVNMITGIITTIAGTGNTGYSGDGGPATSAELNAPDDLGFDPDGNLIMTDNHTVRLLDFSNGNIYTIAGTNIPGFSGDNGPATAAQLNWPDGIAITSSGRAFISDEANHRIRTFIGSLMTLPTALVNFDAHKEGNNAQLKWTTASETNTRSFIVERSPNGFDNWLTVEIVAAAGNSDINRSYTATDSHVLDGINYYRLKQVDMDGKFTHSKVVSIVFDQTNDIAASAYPNPFTNSIKIDLYSKKTTPLNLRVLTIAGQIVKEKTINIYTGENTLILDNLRDLKPGLYMIQLKNDTINIALRLIKQ